MSVNINSGQFEFGSMRIRINSNFGSIEINVLLLFDQMNYANFGFVFFGSSRVLQSLVPVYLLSTGQKKKNQSSQSVGYIIHPLAVQTQFSWKICYFNLMLNSFPTIRYNKVLKETLKYGTSFDALSGFQQSCSHNWLDFQIWRFAHSLPHPPSPTPVFRRLRKIWFKFQNRENQFVHHFLEGPKIMHSFCSLKISTLPVFWH